MNAGGMFVSPADAFHASAPEGEVWIWRPAANVAILVHRGDYSVSLLREVFGFFDPVWESLRDFEVFHDFEHLVSYARETRAAITAHNREFRAVFKAHHFFAKAPAVAMAVGAFGLQSGTTVYSYPDRPSFERALAKAVAESERALPDGRDP